MNELKIYNDIDELLSDLAEAICEASKESIAERGQFNFVLSGGSSPKKLYELLASDSFRHKINWEKVNFFFGDERFVPENDSQRNSLMAKKALFEPLNIAESHIFEIDTSASPEVVAENYQKSIERHFASKRIEFDFILLGLGDDAHTASLFPNTAVLEETESTVKSVFVKELNVYRITMTAPMINRARNIAFLVFGKNKADAVYHVLKDSKGPIQQYPARLIKSDHHKIRWFLDSAAASEL